jgi:hypothetical protein
VLLRWASLAAQAGSATVYDVAGDRVSALRAGRVVDAPCLDRGVPGPTHVDVRPLRGDAFYYLARGTNACGPAAGEGWGAGSDASPRRACP